MVFQGLADRFSKTLLIISKEIYRHFRKMSNEDLSNDRVSCSSRVFHEKTRERNIESENMVGRN